MSFPPFDLIQFLAVTGAMFYILIVPAAIYRYVKLRKKQ